MASAWLNPKPEPKPSVKAIPKNAQINEGWWVSDKTGSGSAKWLKNNGRLPTLVWAFFMEWPGFVKQNTQFEILGSFAWSAMQRMTFSPVS
ncbi:hypothetical protein GCM10027566_03100 [Arachidicoccus ginsenosidivorans]